MTPKSFVYLAAVAVLSALLAIVTFTAGNRWGADPGGGEKLMPALAASSGQVAEISIRQGDETAVLQLGADRTWSLKSRGGYPADTAKVRTLLIGLGEATLVAAKTTRPDKYPALELDDPAAKGAKSRLVKVTDAKGNTIGEAVLGKKRTEGYGTGKTGGTYVRRPGNAQTWLADMEIDAPVATRDWVKTGVLSLDSGKIARIDIEIPGEQALRIERERSQPSAPKEAKGPKAAPKAEAKADAKDAKADAAPPAPAEPGKLAFVGFPGEGKKLKDASAAEAIARSVASIDLEDVRKLDAPPAGDGISLVKVETADGVSATLRLRKEGDAQWLSVAVAAGEGDEARKAAEAIAKATQGWEFKLPAHKAEAILKKRADLLETPGS
jgi:hypothetical protein